MLSLTEKNLPNTIKVGGDSFLVNTDFRTWIRFDMDLMKMKSRHDQIDVSYLFVDKKPKWINIETLMAWAHPAREIPRKTSMDYEDVVALDYEYDADLIYSAFLEQYGIDLMDTDMHWYKFQALLFGLNNTKLNEVMGYRCYKKPKKGEDPYERLKFAWEIIRVSEEEKEELEAFSNMFN